MFKLFSRYLSRSCAQIRLDTMLQFRRTQFPEYKTKDTTPSTMNRRIDRHPYLFHADVTGEVISYCTTDVLNQSQNPIVTNTICSVLKNEGAGSGGNRAGTGTSSHHVQLETDLTMLHDNEAALIFGSGSLANTATLTMLGRLWPTSQIFSPPDLHESLRLGIRYSGCRNHHWTDLKQLQQLLQQTTGGPKIIVSQSIHSVDGTIAPLEHIGILADMYSAIWFLDEARSVGLYGVHGAGLAASKDIQQQVSILSGSLAQAYGVFGGYIVGSHTLISTLRQMTPEFNGTSALPPSICAGASASIDYLQSNTIARLHHRQQVTMLRTYLQKHGLPYLRSDSHIVVIMLGNHMDCQRVVDILLHHHRICVQSVVFPLVPTDSGRLHILPGPLHTEYMLRQLAEAVKLAVIRIGLDLDLVHRITDRLNRNSDIWHPKPIWRPVMTPVTIIDSYCRTPVLVPVLEKYG